MAAKRGGFTLIEMLAVISGLAVILGLCATVLQGLLVTERSERRNESERAALVALAQTFRADVHAATNDAGRVPFVGTPTEALKTLELKLPDGQSVEYRPGPDGLTVTRRGAGPDPFQVVKYPLHSGLAPRLEEQDLGFSVVDRLVFEKADQPRAEALRIEAIRGRDRGLEQREAAP